MQTDRVRRLSKRQTGESRCGPDLAPRLEILPGSQPHSWTHGLSFKGLKLLPRNCAKAHAIARMQQRRRIFERIEKLQRSAADQIPPARRKQRINSRLR